MQVRQILAIKGKIKSALFYPISVMVVAIVVVWVIMVWVITVQCPRLSSIQLAGATGLEPATCGFGDRCSAS